MQFNQYMTIAQVRSHLRHIIQTTTDRDAAQSLTQVDEMLQQFHNAGIDFKEVADGLDDSLLIADAEGTVIYINPAYTVNTGIEPNEILGKSIFSLGKPGGLFTGGAVPDVLKTGKTAFRLSTTYKDGNPKPGYVVGTPLFDENGNVKQVVALSRPIITLRSLENDYTGFVNELRRIEQQGKTTATMDRESTPSKMIGKDTSLAHIWATINQVASSDATVLITGESGCGKEIIADEIYLNSNRADHPFVKINCASIPAHLLESELFGYEKGAFSGANTKGKKGLFEVANNGTLLLDEIGDMPMELQSKLLRAIQSREIVRLGGTSPIRLNIRLIASTNSDLQKKIENKEFRQDLFYRLNVIPIHVPPLRERTEDIPILTDSFIRKFTKKYERSFALQPHQYHYLQKYDWPGNIRELENVIEYLVLCSSGTGTVEDSLLISLLKISQGHEDTVMAAETSGDIDYNQAVANFEKQLLESTLATCSNLREAGEKLGINASTISRKIRQFHIEYPNRHGD